MAHNKDTRRPKPNVQYLTAEQAVITVNVGPKGMTTTMGSGKSSGPKR